MKLHCETCDKVTEGLRMTINGVPMFKCSECKTEQDYVPEKKPASPTVIVNCSGFCGTSK